MVTTSTTLLVVDHLLAQPMAYRALCLAQSFGAVTLGAQTFHGIAPAPTHQVRYAIEEHAPWMDPRVTFLRLSPHGQVEPNDWHDDAMMGTWTGIVYLNPFPPDGDGTVVGDELIPARFNRLLVFPSTMRHCRGLLENYGTSRETSRLIQVVFGGDPSWR